MTFDEIQRLLDAASPAPWGNWIVCTPPQEIPTGEMLPLVHGAGPPHVVHEDSKIDDIGKACRDMDLIVASRTLLPLLLEVARAAKRAEQKLDRMVEKGNLESGVITITEDDFDAWFIRDDLHLALSKLESYKLGEKRE
jgi:hypothetical protein